MDVLRDTSEPSRGKPDERRRFRVAVLFHFLLALLPLLVRKATSVDVIAARSLGKGDEM
jgi:hypothetical protein